MTPILTDLPALPDPGAAAGQAHFDECVRYQLGDLTRVLCTRISNGHTVLIDVPAALVDDAEEPLAANDVYVVEPQLSADGEELVAVVADYVQQVALHRRIPMTVALLDDLFDADSL
jgi:hypothetical protein